MAEKEKDMSAEEELDDTPPVTLTKTESKWAASEVGADPDASSFDQPGYKQRPLPKSVGLFLWEQRAYWMSYLVVLVSAAGCGGKPCTCCRFPNLTASIVLLMLTISFVSAGFSVQAYLFAQFIQTFQYTGAKLLERRDFWSLMFFVLGLGTGACYFALGWVSSTISKVNFQIFIPTSMGCSFLADIWDGQNICAIYRQQYFESILHKPIRFYDQEENSAGSLTARISTDPTQLQELLGINMAFPLISVYNIVGCISIAFAFGWKLTLVAIFTAFPLIIGAMFVRIRYEVKFEAMNAAVFAESSQFASEAIAAFRTVTSLTLEDTITQRYSNLLQSHVKSAFHKGKYASLVFALSDSLELPCMALCFW